MTKHIVAAGRLRPNRAVQYDVEPIAPRVNDIVVFRYYPGRLTVVTLTWSAQDRENIAVVRTEHGQEFACKAADLRKLPAQVDEKR